MLPNDPHTYFSDVASKYLSGNASDLEVRELEKWVLADPENKRQFMAFKKAWMLSGLEKAAPIAHVDDLWKQTAAQLTPEAKVVPIKRNWLRIAAAIALLVLASTVIFYNLRPDEVFLAEATDTVNQVALTDGSQIALNQSSSLSYSFDKKKGTRVVNLTGDAFFDVARDEAHPFIIKTSLIEIEVLGTSFYVDAREGQPEIQVIVESGRVAVRYQSQETILEANEKAVFQISTNQLAKQINEDANYLALKTNKLVFENTSLDEVVFALNRQYHTNIQMENEGLKDCTLSSTFTNKSLTAVLNILESSMPGIEVIDEGNVVVLSGRCE
ncbi:MAG: FecR domain-containing protein [Saprospiraceae bacterium]|nr:FecR domain-containing protein [Saprospiraceae bacterium]